MRERKRAGYFVVPKGNWNLLFGGDTLQKMKPTKWGKCLFFLGMCAAHTNGCQKLNGKHYWYYCLFVIKQKSFKLCSLLQWIKERHHPESNVIKFPFSISCLAAIHFRQWLLQNILISALFIIIFLVEKWSQTYFFPKIPMVCYTLKENRW